VPSYYVPYRGTGAVSNTCHLTISGGCAQGIAHPALGSGLLSIMVARSKLLGRCQQFVIHNNIGKIYES